VETGKPKREYVTRKKKLPMAASPVSDPFSVEVGPIQSPWTPKGRSYLLEELTPAQTVRNGKMKE